MKGTYALFSNVSNNIITYCKDSRQQRLEFFYKKFIKKTPISYDGCLPKKT